MGILFQGTVEQIISTIDQKRCATVIVNAKFLDNPLSLFNIKLAWLARNISIFHKIRNGSGPIIIFPYYVNYSKSSHGQYKHGDLKKK